jgi:hypothetical protein
LIAEDIGRFLDGPAHLQDFRRERVPESRRAGSRHARSLEYGGHRTAGNRPCSCGRARRPLLHRTRSGSYTPYARGPSFVLVCIFARWSRQRLSIHSLSPSCFPAWLGGQPGQRSKTILSASFTFSIVSGLTWP